MVKDQQDLYYELYKVALATAAIGGRADMTPQAKAKAASDQAIVFMGSAYHPSLAHGGGTTLPNANVGGGGGSVAPQGHRFGPAFQGWPEDGLVRCLAAIQELVIARENGATIDHQAPLQEYLQQAISGLVDQRVELRKKAAEKKS